MRKFQFAALLLVVVLLLTACSGSPATETSTTTPLTTGTESVETTQQVPLTGETQVATLEASPVVSSTATGIGTPSASGTQPAGASQGLEGVAPNTLSKLNGYQIVDQNCELVASVNGFVVSSTDGVILYLVATPMNSSIASGTFLLPWSATQMNLSGSTSATSGNSAGSCDLVNRNLAFMLTVPASQISSVPTINSVDTLNQDLAADNWDAQAVQFWTKQGVTVFHPTVGGESGAVPSTQATPVATATSGASAVGNAVFISNTNNYAVVDPSGTRLGSVSQFIVDPQNYTITNVVVLADDRYIPVPWSAFQWQNDNGTLSLVLNADAAKLQGAPGYNSLGEFPDVSQSGWDTDIATYWAPAGNSGG